MNTIIIDTDKMQETITLLNTLSNDLDTYCSEIDNSVYGTLNSVWSGDDATSFISSVHDGVVNDLNNIKIDLDEYSGTLFYIKDLYQDLDANFAGRSCSL